MLEIGFIDINKIESKAVIVVSNLTGEITIGWTLDEINAALITSAECEHRAYLLIAREILQLRQELAQLRKI